MSNFKPSNLSPAKINLFLHILGRRADGYHELQSLVYFTEFGDHITIAESDQYRLNLSGPYGDILARESLTTPNLVTRAVDMLTRITGRPFAVQIDIEKHIPLGGGLGGGSSNAVTVLKALKAAYQLDVDLSVITSALGSDLTAFLHAPHPLMMRGTGNDITPLPHPLPRFQVILEHGGLSCPTAAVYKRFEGPFSQEISMTQRFEDVEQLTHFLKTQTRNDLVPAALSVAPGVANTLKTLRADPDNLFVQMSGSGATCFAIRRI